MTRRRFKYCPLCRRNSKDLPTYRDTPVSHPERRACAATDGRGLPYYGKSPQSSPLTEMMASCANLRFACWAMVLRYYGRFSVHGAIDSYCR